MDIVEGFPVHVQSIYALATLSGAAVEEFRGLPFSIFSAQQDFYDVVSKNDTQGSTTSRIKAAYSDAFESAPVIQIPRIMASLPHDNSSVGIMQAAMGCTALTLMAVCMRFYSRVAVAGPDFKVKKSIKVEDWLILGASVCGQSDLKLLPRDLADVVTHGGQGKRSWDITYNESHLNLFLLLPTNVVFILVLLFTKLALVFEYRNFTIAGLDRNKFFRVICVFIGGIIILGSIASIFGFIVKCGAFDYWTSPVQANCVRTRERHLAISGFDVLTNIILLLLPVALLPSLTLRTRHKILIGLFFLIGLLACSISAIRTLVISKFYESVNPFYDETSMHFLYLLEAQLIILCSCMPALRALCHHRLRGTTDFKTRRGSVAYNIDELARSKSTRVTIHSLGTNSSPNTPRSIEDEESVLECAGGNLAVAVKITEKSNHHQNRHTMAATTLKKLPPVPQSDSPVNSVKGVKLKRVYSMPVPVTNGSPTSSKRASLVVATASSSTGDVSFTGLSPTPPLSPVRIPYTAVAPKPKKKAPPPAVKIPTMPVVKLILTPPPVGSITPASIHLGTIPPPLPPPNISLPELPAEEASSPKPTVTSFSSKRRISNAGGSSSGSSSGSSRSSFTTPPSNRSSVRLSGCPAPPQKAKAIPAPLNLRRLSAIDARLDVSLDSFPATPPIAKQFHSPPGTPGTPGSPLIKLRLTPAVARSPRFPPARTVTPP